MHQNHDEPDLVYIGGPGQQAFSLLVRLMALPNHFRDIEGRIHCLMCPTPISSGIASNIVKTWNRRHSRWFVFATLANNLRQSDALATDFW